MMAGLAGVIPAERRMVSNSIAYLADSDPDGGERTFSVGLVPDSTPVHARIGAEPTHYGSNFAVVTADLGDVLGRLSAGTLTPAFLVAKAAGVGKAPGGNGTFEPTVPEIATVRSSLKTREYDPGAENGFAALIAAEGLAVAPAWDSVEYWMAVEGLDQATIAADLPRLTDAQALELAGLAGDGTPLALAVAAERTARGI